MSTFTVTEVSDKIREYPTDYGPKKAYRIHLRNGDGTDHLNIEWRRNADSPAPTVGQQIEAELVDQGQYGQRLQLAQRGGAGGVWSGTKSEDPQRQKRIVRQHSQSMALQAISLAFDRGLFEPGTEPTSSKDLFRLIGTVTDWFDKDVESAAS